MTATRGSGPRPALLRVRGLSMHFGGVIVINDVDLQVEDGELLCLIGPNGAGKTTFFKTLTGQLRPSSGSIEFLGRPLVGLQRHEIARRGIGVKTQVPSVFDGLSVRESLYLAVRAQNCGAGRRERMARVDGLLEEVRIGAIADHTLAQLAHGQRQWVELAMVLAAEPRLVLLDEPVAGMSDEETARTAALVRRLRGRRTLIVVEHDMRFVRDIAERVAVLHQGALLCEGAVDEVLGNERVRDVYLGRGDGAARTA